MSRSKLAYYLVLLLVISISNNLSAVETPEPIIVGILHSEQFPTASMMQNSFEMSLQSINKADGINGRPLKLVYADDGGSANTGERAVKGLVKKSGAVMLVGGYESSNTIHTARVADELNIPFLITTAADDRITQREWKNVYRMNPPAKEYAKGVEELLLKKVKPASMAIVYENSPYGTGAALRMMWFCRENDIEIIKIIPYHKERASAVYFEGLLKPLRSAHPDVIYMISYLEDGVSLVNTIKEMELDSILIGGAGGFTDEKFISMTGDSAKNLLTATLWTPQSNYPGSKEYHNLYLKQHSEHPDYHGAEAYSSLFVVADVLKRAKSLQPEDIRKAMNETDMNTTFGPVKFQSYDKFERQNKLPTMVLQIINGAFEVVWPEKIATSEVILSHGRTESMHQ